MSKWRGFGGLILPLASLVTFWPLISSPLIPGFSSVLSNFDSSFPLASFGTTQAAETLRSVALLQAIAPVLPTHHAAHAAKRHHAATLETARRRLGRWQRGRELLALADTYGHKHATTHLSNSLRRMEKYGSNQRLAKAMQHLAAATVLQAATTDSSASAGPATAVIPGDIDPTVNVNTAASVPPTDWSWASNFAMVLLLPVTGSGAPPASVLSFDGSTTADPAVAVSYGKSEATLLLKIATRSFMERGADLSFLSAFPGEREYLFAPLTYLQPTGRREVVVVGEAEYTVVEVEPHFAS